MDFLSTVGVQELNSFAELSASYNAVVDKQELFTLDKLVNEIGRASCRERV